MHTCNCRWWCLSDWWCGWSGSIIWRCLAAAAEAEAEVVGSPPEEPDTDFGICMAMEEVAAAEVTAASIPRRTSSSEWALLPQKNKYYEGIIITVIFKHVSFFQSGKLPILVMWEMSFVSE